MKTLLSLFLFLSALSLKAADGSFFPSNVTIKVLVGSGDHVAVDAGGRLMRTNIAGGGGGTPGGSTFSLQYNGTNTFGGDTNAAYFPEHNDGDLVAASFVMNFQGASNVMTGQGFGTTTFNPLYFLVNGQSRWRVETNGHLIPSLNSTYDIGTSTVRPRTNYATYVSASTAIEVGVGSSTNGRALFYDMAGVKYSQLEAPGAVINTNTHRLWQDTNAGVVVEYTTIAGINQLANITLTAGQVVSHNGTSYVATNAIKGATNGGNAAAGYIGEFISATFTNRVTGATGVITDSTNIVLTPGDWDVTGIMCFNRNGATFAATVLNLGISTTSGNLGTGLDEGDNSVLFYPGGALPSPDLITLTIPVWRFSTATNATLYYKSTVSSYSAGSPVLAGRLSARRVR